MPSEQGKFYGLPDLLDKLKIFLTGMSAEAWTVRSDTTTGSGEALQREILFQTPGGLELGVQLAHYLWDYTSTYDFELDITVIQPNSDPMLPSPYLKYLRLQGYTGHTNGLGFDEQPGALPATQTPATIWRPGNKESLYWFSADGDVCHVWGRCGGHFLGPLYFGSYAPAGTAANHPHPIALGAPTNLGPDDSTANYFVGQTPNDVGYFFPGGSHGVGDEANLMVRSGADWIGMTFGQVHPFGNFWNSNDEHNAWSDSTNSVTQSTRADDEDYPACMGSVTGRACLWPLTMGSLEPTRHLVGTLRHVYAVAWGHRTSYDDTLSLGDRNFVQMPPVGKAFARNITAAMELL